MNINQILSLFRLVLQVSGAMLAQKGLTTENVWNEVTGAVLVLVGFIWSMCHHADPKTPQPPITGSFSALLFGACTAFAMLLPGCATRPVVTTDANGLSVTNFVKGPDVGRISGLAGGAAKLGTQFRLAGHPEDRAIFETTRQALQGLADRHNYDPAAFADAISRLPVHTLEGEEGAIYISGAIFIWDEAISISEPVTQQELVKATLTAVAEGIGRGLAATAPRSQLYQNLRNAWERDRIETIPVLDVTDVVMPRWRPALLPAEVIAQLTYSVPAN